MSSKDYRIKPPPEDKGSEPLFRVVYVIDINASGPVKAAKLVHQMMADANSLPPVLEVIDHEGKVTKLDLSKKRKRMKNMLNKIFDMIAQVLDGIDVGGEQSRQFSEEIKILRQVRRCLLRRI